MGPIDKHPLRADPVSAAANQRIRVGSRTLLAVSDGIFRMPRDFVGTEHLPTAAYDALHAQYGEVRMPLGCFLWPGDSLALIDTGFGPFEGSAGMLVGGLLPTSLASVGVQFADVDVIALSHLHADHIGWIADENGDPAFPNARVFIGRADWDYFVLGGHRPAPRPRVLHALQMLADRGQIELVDGETTIVGGLKRLPAPGHTPGHSIYVVHDGGERVLLFGDALYCPHQLEHDDWQAMSDVDARLASRTRARYLRDLEANGGGALGCHFPELQMARVWGAGTNSG
jgi:glyoxylase-like metal-dependent hydrolase (beta-lactamase superfamily II)